MLTGLLVLAVAFFGYRLLLGHGLVLSDAVGLAVRIGVVLMLASSWSAWQNVAYDTLARAPTQIANDMLDGIGAKQPLAGLDYMTRSLDAVGAGYRERAGMVSPMIGGPAAAAMTLNVSSQLLVLSTVGVLVAARVVLALLLALAPLMAGFILFDATRGMAEGWLRAMVSAALVPLFVIIFASVEFAILLPLVNRLFAAQAAGTFDVAAATPIGLVTITFALATAAGILAGAKIAQGIRLPRKQDTAPKASEPQQAAAPQPAQPAAIHLAQVLEGLSRRETVAAPAGSHRVVQSLTRNAPRVSASSSGGHWSPMSGPAHFTSRRAPRQSRAAARRDA
jgi:type IV secretion system protein VirB6